MKIIWDIPQRVIDAVVKDNSLSETEKEKVFKIKMKEYFSDVVMAYEMDIAQKQAIEDFQDITF